MTTVVRLKLILVLIAVLAGVTITLALPPQDSTLTTWTPPSTRKAKTPFAPRPLGGDNIFKGEAEKWLANSIVKLEVGFLMPIDDKFVNEYLSQVGNHLVAHSVAPAKQHQFIATYDLVANAMTVGGGRIYISRGMLNQVENEDELAGVLAHEIAHDAFGHAPKTVTRQLFWMTGVRKVKTAEEVESALAKLLAEYEKKPLAAIGESLLGFARFDELEADRAAFYNTYKAGYNPHALATVLKRMERDMKEEMGEEDGWAQFIVLLFGSHPPTPQRSMAFSWESNFVKMPPKDSHYQSAAFNAMKAKVAKLPK
ncbi:MAG: M48 family metallopeptidase [Pyrinomonadaceae bacterium]|nr:M48 family metallopeptidase [Pyrinomonadaceae bacterium]